MTPWLEGSTLPDIDGTEINASHKALSKTMDDENLVKRKLALNGSGHCFGRVSAYQMRACARNWGERRICKMMSKFSCIRCTCSRRGKCRRAAKIWKVYPRLPRREQCGFN